MKPFFTMLAVILITRFAGCKKTANASAPVDQAPSTVTQVPDTFTSSYIGIDGGNVTNGAECWSMLTHPYAFNGHTGWVGISHFAVFQNPGTQQWFYASQQRLPPDLPGSAASNALMMGNVRQIGRTGEDGRLLHRNVFLLCPTNQSRKVVTCTWEKMLLKYQYKLIQRHNMVLAYANLLHVVL